MMMHGLRLLVMVALVMVAWHRTFLHMWDRWFPAWGQMDLSLWDRLMTGETYYRHGPLVLAVSAALALAAWRRQSLARPDSQPRLNRDSFATPLGYAVMGASIALHLLSTWVGVGFASGFALVGLLVGWLLASGGWGRLRAYGSAAALLVFMVPLPLVWIAQLNFSLKMFAAGASAQLVTMITGAHPTIDGAQVVLMGPTGLPESLSIDTACSGLRSLMALTWFAAAFAAMCRLTVRWRWAMLALAVPLAVACNVVRIAVLIAAAQTWGVDAVAEDAPLHSLAGLAAFAAALGALLALEQAALALGSGVGATSTEPRRGEGREEREAEQKDRCDDRLIGMTTTRPVLPSPHSSSPSRHLPPPSRFSSSRLRALRPFAIQSKCKPPSRFPSMCNSALRGLLEVIPPALPALTLVLIAAAGSLWLGRPARVTAAPPAPWMAAPALRVDDVSWRGRDLPISDSLRAALGTPNILHRRYTCAARRGVLDLVVVHHARDRQAIHPPTVCLEAQGHRLIAQRDRAVTLPDGRTVTLRELTTRHADRQYTHLYVYRTGDHYTTSYLQQQLAAVWPRPADAAAHPPAALIRVSASGVDIDTLTHATASLLP